MVPSQLGHKDRKQSVIFIYKDKKSGNKEYRIKCKLHVIK